MLRLFIGLIVLMHITVGCRPKELPTQMTNTEDKIELKISHMTTKQELEKIASEFKTSNVHIDFSNSVFFDNGKMRVLALNVITPNGNVGSCTADLVTLQYKYYGFEFNPKSGDMHIGHIQH